MKICYLDSTMANVGILVDFCDHLKVTAYEFILGFNKKIIDKIDRW